MTDDWRKMDWSLMLVTLGLVVLGLVMIYSASAISAYQIVGSTEYFFRRQVLWSLVGLAACLLVAGVSFDLIRVVTPAVYGGVIVSLVLALIPMTGREAGGAWRWVDLGVVGFQPSEFAKLVLILVCALYLTRHGETPSNVTKTVFVVTGVTLFPVILIALQPDVGTAFQLGLIGWLMIYLAGVPLPYLLLLGVLAVPMGAVAIFSSGYRTARVMAYLDPWSDPFDKGYHAIQFFRALADGGLTGRGLGESTRKMGYLPEPYTDSIVAVVGEELGYLGILFLMVLIGYLVFRGFAIALQATDPYRRMVGVGVTASIGLQACLNMAVVSGVVPTTGVAMPFVSYGGSALLVNMLGVGLLLRISRGR